MPAACINRRPRKTRNASTRWSNSLWNWLSDSKKRNAFQKTARTLHAAPRLVNCYSIPVIFPVVVNLFMPSCQGRITKSYDQLNGYHTVIPCEFS